MSVEEGSGGGQISIKFWHEVKDEKTRIFFYYVFNGRRNETE